MRPKSLMLVNYAISCGCKVFVETGTFKGDTVKLMLHRFDEIHTIDTEKIRVMRTQRRFRDFPYVHCHYGDSSVILPEILSKINEPVMFWLDAHYIGVPADRGQIATPILSELQTVLSHDYNDVILIDDKRLFSTERLPGYPPVEEIIAIIREHCPKAIIHTSGDVIQARKC